VFARLESTEQPVAHVNFVVLTAPPVPTPLAIAPRAPIHSLITLEEQDCAAAI